MKKSNKLYMNDFPNFIQKLYSKISKNAKLAFYFTSIITFITHLTFFVERWLNEDDFHYIFGENQNIGLGRWMDSSILGSHYLVPIVLLIITMISLGISSALIISMFKIKNNFYIFIISALLATFPVLALGFGYLFMVERYVLGILVGILATYITNKYKYGFILGGVFLAITLGYYQSYISITIGLSMFLILIKGFGNINMKNYLIYILKFLLMGILGVFLYLIMVKVTCHLSGTSLFEYKGINNMGSLPPLNEIPGLIKRTYGHFLGFFLGKYFLKPLNYGLYVQLILLFINSILILMIVIKNKIYKNILKLGTISLFLILLPLGLNIIDFIAYQSNVSSLNIYQFVLMLILPFILFNYISKLDYIKVEGKIFFHSVLSWVISLSALLLIWNNFIVTNIYYLKINHFYTYTVQLTNRIYSKIESIEGFNFDTKVLIGNFNGVYKDLKTNNDFGEIFLYDQGLWDQFIGYYPVSIQSDFKFHMLVSNVLGIKLKSVSKDEYDMIYNSQKYNEMKSWPHSDCVKFIGNILVVKIS